MLGAQAVSTKGSRAQSDVSVVENNYLCCCLTSELYYCVTTASTIRSRHMLRWSCPTTKNTRG